MERTAPAAADAAPRRKLAAILSADVVGYSRLMGDDDSATLATLTAYRKVFAEHICVHEGRVIDSPGDALLAEFSSAVEAVNCAVDIQRELAGRNAPIPEHRRMRFRIGVNLGDVTEQAGALYGDGVNIAARLESLAEPGGICISGTVYDHVEGKLPVSFKFAGEQSVKNIAKPLRMYRALLDFAEQPRLRAPHWRGKQKISVIAIIGVAMAVISFGVWYATRGFGVTDSSVRQGASLARGTGVAVLPFTNLDGDTSQDYFSDGLTEDIITELARVRDLRVTARNTTFQYKGKAVDVVDVGKALNVDYILEGSVRRASGQVRIVAQLIDARTGAHIWANRYDRKLSEIFVVQNEIARKIASTMAGGNLSVLDRAGREILGRKPPERMEVYDLVLRSGNFDNDWSAASYAQAKADLERAIQLDPNYARARQRYAWVRLLGWIAGFEPSMSPPPDIKKNAIQAVSLEPDDPWAHRTAAFGYYFDKQFEQFEREAQIAMDLAPSNAEILVEMGSLIAHRGDWRRGIEIMTSAYALDPINANGWYQDTLAIDLYRRGDYSQALEMLLKTNSQDLEWTQMKFIATYIELGDSKKAHEHVQKALSISPRFSVQRAIQAMQLWNFPEPVIQKYAKDLETAGVPAQADLTKNNEVALVSRIPTGSIHAASFCSLCQAA
jgi:adenylate cyclase